MAEACSIVIAISTKLRLLSTVCKYHYTLRAAHPACVPDCGLCTLASHPSQSFSTCKGKLGILAQAAAQASSLLCSCLLIQQACEAVNGSFGLGGGAATTIVLLALALSSTILASATLLATTVIVALPVVAAASISIELSLAWGSKRGLRENLVDARWMHHCSAAAAGETVAAGSAVSWEGSSSLPAWQLGK